MSLKYTVPRGFIDITNFNEEDVTLDEVKNTVSRVGAKEYKKAFFINPNGSRLKIFVPPTRIHYEPNKNNKEKYQIKFTAALDNDSEDNLNQLAVVEGFEKFHDIASKQLNARKNKELGIRKSEREEMIKSDNFPRRLVRKYRPDDFNENEDDDENKEPSEVNRKNLYCKLYDDSFKVLVSVNGENGDELVEIPPKKIIRRYCKGCFYITPYVCLVNKLFNTVMTANKVYMTELGGDGDDKDNDAPEDIIDSISNEQKKKNKEILDALLADDTEEDDNEDKEETNEGENPFDKEENPFDDGGEADFDV